MRFHSHPGPGVHLPPPVWVIGCMMLGLLLDRLAALPPLPLPALAASLLGGALMLAGSGAIAAGVIGIDSAGAFMNYVVVGFVWKTLMEVVLLPVTYPTIAAVRRAETSV